MKINPDLLPFKNLSRAKYVTDLDACTESGQYQYNSNTLNSPYKQNSNYNNFGLVIVVNNNDNDYPWIYQIAFGTHDEIYGRSKINTDDWSEWLPITTTKVSTTSDGYTKIVYPEHTEYFKRGNFTASMSASSWNATLKTITLPSEVKGSTTNRFVTGAVRSNDGAVMVGWNDDANNFIISGNNTYAGSVKPTIYYTIRVIKFTT